MSDTGLEPVTSCLLSGFHYILPALCWSTSLYFAFKLEVYKMPFGAVERKSGKGGKNVKVFLEGLNWKI